MANLIEGESILSPSEFLARSNQEHAILKRIYADLIIAYNQSFRTKAIEKILRILPMYVRFHFDNEERFMVAVNYPDLDNHRRVHADFIVTLAEIKQRFCSGADVYNEVRLIYTSLAHGHIPEDDAKLHEFVLSGKPDRTAGSGVVDLSWGDAFRTGVDSIDDEHERIFCHYQKAFEAIRDRATDSRLRLRLLADFEAVVKKHFADEEDLMAGSAFPGRAAHIKQHFHYLSVIAKLRHSIEDGRADSDAMFSFFRNWVGCHMMVSDMEFAVHLRDRSPDPQHPTS